MPFNTSISWDRFLLIYGIDDTVYIMLKKTKQKTVSTALILNQTVKQHGQSTFNPASPPPRYPVQHSTGDVE